MMSTTQRVLSAIAATVLVVSTALAAEPKRGSFAEFDARAKACARLNVVFFGASLTWGANASDPAETSYRAVMRDRFEQHYPAAHFRFRDAAIGGTGSQLGVFRLDRDVLAHKPDLVFVDFTANDGIYSDDAETLASYESILRRLATAGIPVVQVAFPFKWDIETAKLPTMKRRLAHQALAAAYGNGWGDAVTRICREVDAGRLTREALWVTDGVHPHDPGYREFAAAAWDGYLAAVKAGLAPRVPAQPVYADTYLTLRRFNLAGLPSLPRGWSKGRPNLTAVNHDWLMSRWLDDLVVARNRKPDEQGTPAKESQPVPPLRLKVEATAILLFGESTADSGRFRVLVDGVAVTGKGGQEQGADWFEGNRWKTGNGFLLWEVARGLDPSVPHLLEIEPVFDSAKAQELKLESICVAGGKATVMPPNVVPPTTSNPRVYAGTNLTGIELPLGGIGAGCVFMDGAAQRTKWMFWEAWTKAPVIDSFFAVRMRVGNDRPIVRALQTMPIGDLKGLDSLTFMGEYPFGRYDFQDPACPVKLCLEAYSPLVPPGEKDSGIPCAIYNLTAENTHREAVEVSFLATQQNAIGFRQQYVGNSNRVVRLDAATIVEMTTSQPPDGQEFGSLALVAMAPEATACASWDNLPRLVERFADDGRVQGPLSATTPATGQTVNAAMAVPFVLKPSEKRTVTFALTWHFPNVRQKWGSLTAEKFWGGNRDWSATAVGPEKFWGGDWSATAVGRQYANWWPGALAVAKDLVARLPELEGRTRLFHDTLYASNLPRWLLDGLSSQIAILRSPSCFWNRDGYFGCFEGFRERVMVKHDMDGNCNHVLQYAQLHAYLFPSIARNLRDSELALQHADGRLSHRQTGAYHGPIPALDGSCGAVLGAYREYCMSADSAWLNGTWPKVKKAMESIIATWDRDEDGVLGGSQWTTMDDVVTGSTTWLGSLYLAALGAAERMARLQNDATTADRYRGIRLSGSSKQDTTLFNGEYYIQTGEGGAKIGTGCASDQLLGQWWAHQLDLGWLYPPDRVRTALQNMVRYNFLPSFQGVDRKGVCKHASDDDGGMMMITWPKGGRPAPTFDHVSHCWAGSEYAVAALLIQSGLADDGLKIAKAVRDRYDGRKRDEWTIEPGGNPFGEVEWGMFYTRSLSIWSLLTACQGYRYDGPAGAIGFDPVWSPGDHASFFTVAEGWGLFTQKRDQSSQTDTLELRHGRLRLSALTFCLPLPADRVRSHLTVDGVAVRTTPQSDGQRVTLRLEKPLEMQATRKLVARFELTDDSGK